MRSDEELFTGIFEQNSSSLIRYCRYKGFLFEDSEEMVIEAFSRMWKKFSEIKALEPKQQKMWLYSALNNIMLEKQRETDLAEDFYTGLDEVLDKNDRIEKVIEEDQFQTYVSLLEDELTENERKVFRMILYSRKTLKQLADENGMKDVTLRAYVSKLRAKLRPLVSDLPDGLNKK